MALVDTLAATSDFYPQIGLPDTGKKLNKQPKVSAKLRLPCTNRLLPEPTLHNRNKEKRKMKTTTLALAMILTCAGCSPAPKTSPLHDAAENGTVADVTALLKAGADPNVRTEDGWTPLHEAASQSDNPAVITALLEAGANPNAQNRLLYTPLHHAALSNDNPAAIIEALVKAGADLIKRAV